MKTEFEVRYLEISFDDMIKRIESLGAKQVGVYHQKRYVYDFIPEEKGRWIRLRNNGVETTLTIKEIKSSNVDGTKELEIIVSNFEDTNEILGKLGYVPRTYQENFRIEYNLDGVNFDLDKWPMIPAYLEIEGNSEKEVLDMLKRLEIDFSEATTIDVDKVYKEKYGIDLDKIKILKFDKNEEAFISQYKKD